MNNNFRRAREDAQRSQKDIAISLKVSAPTVSEWESGKKRPNLDNLKALSNEYNVSTDFLLGLTDSPERVNIKKKTIRSRHPISVLAAMYDISSDIISKIAKVDLNTAENWVLGAITPNDDKTKLLADFFELEAEKLQMGIIPFYPSPSVQNKIDEMKNVRSNNMGKPLMAQKIGEFVEILHIASISAGYNGLATEDAYEYVSIPSVMLKGYPPTECRLMTVKGDSMYPYYMSGDKVVVHIQPSVDSGDIAVIIYDTDEATIKKVNYVYGEDWLELVPINPEYQTKRIEKEDLELCKVYGKVISSMRY